MPCDGVSELVVDTNIFLHASNEGVKYCDSARSLLKVIIQNDIAICVDDVYDSNPARTTSRIGSEYERYITPGTHGHTMLLTIINSGKIKQIEKKKYNTQKRILTRIIRDKTDLVFVVISIGVAGQTLASNDFEDLSQRKRLTINNKFGVSIVTSIELMAPTRR